MMGTPWLVLLPLWLQAPVLVPEADEPLVFSVRKGGQDGTLSDAGRWFEQGVFASNNVIGWYGGKRHRLLLRFDLSRLKSQGRLGPVEYVRLVVPAADQHAGEGPYRLVVRGGANRSTLGARVGSEPFTAAQVSWTVATPWRGQPHKERKRCMAVRRYSPDLTPIFEELVQDARWTGQVVLALEIDEDEAESDRYLTVEDNQSRSGRCPSDQSAKLEIYPTLRSTFLGKELLGRVTDSSVTLNMHALVPMEVRVAYGTNPDALTEITPAQSASGGEELELTLNDLASSTRYHYRVSFRRANTDTPEQQGPLRSFHTARRPGESFSFAIQADPHLQGLIRTQDRVGTEMYRRSLALVAEGRPDFLIDLGDTFHTQFFAGRDAVDEEEAVHRHLDHRRFFDLTAHSVPLFLVMGNHEGEQGWQQNGTADNLAMWATRARKRLYPNPISGPFFSTPDYRDPFIGERESMYAFQWGDVLFVALDPFWFTTRNPHAKRPPDPQPWAWTLGEVQYRWLRDTLERSQARYKLVFAHHMTGGLEPWNPYGRGGARGARHALGGQGSFEWGGEHRDGTYQFDERRPGWGKPIHQLFIDTGVTAFFHGHDHCFAYEKLDGIVYQAVPTPADSTQGRGFCNRPHLYGGAELRYNSGFLRVAVTPERVQVQYMRVVLGVPSQTHSVPMTYEIQPRHAEGQEPSSTR